MTRPAIDPDNIRRNQPGHKIRRYWVVRLAPYALFIAAVYVIGCIHTLDAHMTGVLP